MTSLKPNSKLGKRGTIIGMIIGDGHIQVKNNKTEGSVIFEHSRKQESYCRYKMSRLNELLDVEYSIYENKGYDKRSGNFYPTTRGITKPYRYFKKLKDLMYPNGKKTLSRKILDYITPEGLAYWYMDDGCMCVHREKKGGMRRYSFFSTQCFSYEEHLVIQKYFKDKWNIEVRINKCGRKKDGTHRYRTVLNVANTKKLLPIIKPYIHESMLYKVDMKYSIPQTGDRQ